MPVMNTDDGFILLFNNPSDAFLREAAGRIIRPFPAGLRTEVGLVVANTALDTFGRLVYAARRATDGVSVRMSTMAHTAAPTPSRTRMTTAIRIASSPLR